MSIIAFAIVGSLCALAIRQFWRMWLTGDAWALLYIAFALLFPASWMYGGIRWLRSRRVKHSVTQKV